MTAYTSTRVRGLASWKPNRKTVDLLEQVADVLHEYREHLPLTARQVFYRLVGAYGYPKDERAYERLLEKLNRARRADMVPFDAIRDDGVTEIVPSGFSSVGDFWGRVRATAGQYRRHRQHGQPWRVELWVEAAGMVPQVARVARRYGIPTYSSSGFNSLTAKHEAACRALDRDVPTAILSVGDHDPSGVAIFDSAAEDVSQLVRDLGGGDCVLFERVAVTPEQIEEYGLPGSPPKKNDNRGDWKGLAVQCEALAPPDLAREVEEVIGSFVDARILADVLAEEKDERARLVARTDVLLGGIA